MERVIVCCNHYALFLQKYLSNEEFEQYLGTTREDFYKLPEFKRNDIKRKVSLMLLLQFSSTKAITLLWQLSL